MHLKCWRAGLIALLLSMSAAAAEVDLKPALDYFKHGDYARAQSLLTDAQTQNPQNAEIAYYLGRIAHRRKDWKTAVAQLQRAVSLQADSAEYHFRLGLSLSRYIETIGVISKPAIALRIRESLQKAIELNPDFIDARDALLKYDLAAPAFLGGSVDKARGQAVEIAKRSAGDGHIAQAEIDQDQDQIEQAIAEYKAAISAGNSSSAQDARIALSELYRRQRRYDEAMELLQQALRKNPGDRQAQFALGNTAVQCGCRIEAGIAALQAFLAQAGNDDDDDPSPALAHLLLGKLYEKAQRREDASAEYRIAQQLDAQLEEARQALRSLD